MNQIEGSVADDLISDVHVARLRVSSFGDFDHLGSLDRCQGTLIAVFARRRGRGRAIAQRRRLCWRRAAGVALVT